MGLARRRLFTVIASVHRFLTTWTSYPPYLGGGVSDSHRMSLFWSRLHSNHVRFVSYTGSVLLVLPTEFRILFFIEFQTQIRPGALRYATRSQLRAKSWPRCSKFKANRMLPTTPQHTRVRAAGRVCCRVAGIVLFSFVLRHAIV